MTDGLRRLVALASTLAPARAARLLGRLDVPGAAEAAGRAAALAEAPRRARLAALAAALPDAGGRPDSADRPLPAHPLLRRLELERRHRPAAPRTVVRASSPPAGRHP